MSDPSLNELLEACRPDRGDLDWPEMGPLAVRLAGDEALRERLSAKCREDVALGAALEDVPIPAGLLERLELAVMANESVAVAEARDRSGDVRVRTTSVERPEPRSQSDTRTRSPAGRPRWFVTSWLAGGLALGLVGALFAFWLNGWKNPSGPASAEELAAASAEWSEALNDGWESELNEVAMARPPATGIRARLVGWQSRATEYDSQTIVYSLQRDSASALLFVVRTPASFLPDREPMRRLPSSGGMLAGAWKSGELLYVLVVRGEQSRLEDFFAPVPRRVAVRESIPAWRKA